MWRAMSRAVRSALMVGFVVGICLVPLVASAGYPSLSAPVTVERSGENDVALIVAVEDYVFLPDVSGAIDNGTDWEVFLERDLGVEEIYFLSNHSATAEEIRRFASLAAREVGEGGTLWFVFIGHGAPVEDGSDGILVGMDAQQTPGSLTARGVRQQELLDLLEEGAQSQTVAVVDACFSGRDSQGEALVDAQPVVPVQLRPSLDETRTAVLSAAQAREFAGPLPGVERPAFSYLLLGALRGWADDGTGAVTAGSALRYTQRQLRGIPGRFDQTPALYGDSGLVLVRGVEEGDPGVRDVMRAMIRQDSTIEEAPGDVVAPRDPRPEPVARDCPTGMITTQGECCWPGQAWSGSRNKCIGTPQECPDGYRVDTERDRCVLPDCEEGKVRVAGTTACCWPGQDWLEEDRVCGGAPDSCPAGMVIDGLAGTCADEPSCEHGLKRVDGTVECCWPGQAWSGSDLSCVGEPAYCPDGTWMSDGSCSFSSPFSGGTLAVQSSIGFTVGLMLVWSAAKRDNFVQTTFDTMHPFEPGGSFGLAFSLVTVPTMIARTSRGLGQRSYKRGSYLGGIVLGTPMALGMSVALGDDMGGRSGGVGWATGLVAGSLGGHYLHRKISSQRTADLMVMPLIDSGNDRMGTVFGLDMTW